MLDVDTGRIPKQPQYLLYKKIVYKQYPDKASQSPDQFIIYLKAFEIVKEFNKIQNPSDKDMNIDRCYRISATT